MAEKNSKLYQELSSIPSGKETELVGPLYINDLEKRIPKVSDNTAHFDKTEWLDPKVPTDGLYRIYYKADNLSEQLEHNFIWLVEFKDSTDFADKHARSIVYLQICCYIKQIHNLHYGYDNGPKTWENLIPKVIMLGSRVNAVALPAKFLATIAKNSYIEDWEHATEACKNPKNKNIIDEISEDAQINAYSAIYDIKSTSELDRLCENIIKYGTGEGNLQEDLSSQTIYYAFDYFDMKVLDKKQSEKMTSREKVSAFIGLFFNPDSIEIKKRRELYVDTVIINGSSIKVNGEEYNNFTIIFRVEAEKYTKAEKKQITAITDRLIEETDRRRKGDFYTPTIWVDEAHKLLSKNLGEDWREEYMVWDCAWGTGNLTRDYRFKDLYCSTLEETDLQIGFEYNKNACKFQYDFLNDDVEDFERIEMLCKMGRADTANAILFNTKLYKQAPGLIEGLLGINGKEKKKLLFLINPPYKKAGAITSGESSGKISNEKSKLSVVYNTNSSQLYSQFLFRIMKIKQLFKVDTSVGIFCPSAIFSVDEHRDLLKEMYNENIKYTEGFIFKSSHFDGTGNDWPVAFSVFKNNDSVFKYDFDFRLLDLVGTRLDHIGNKNVYTVDKNKQLASWCKRNIKNAKREAVPYLSNALGNEDRSIKYTKGGYKNIGGFWCHSNRVTDNNSRVSLWTAIPNQASGNPITEETFNDMISVFSARRLISGAHKTWLNDTDQYMIPDLDNEKYDQWLSDCIILALFNSTSFQTSLRSVICQGKQWNIQNEFFWMSVDEMQALAEGKYNRLDINNTVEDDIEEFGFNRFVYKKLKEVTLSPDAQAVLDKATELVKSSFRYRNDFNKSHPEYQINTWDAGWYQIKGLLKEYDPDGLREFNSLYKAFEDRMRPLVYELGFLYK